LILVFGLLILGIGGAGHLHFQSLTLIGATVVALITVAGLIVVRLWVRLRAQTQSIIRDITERKQAELEVRRLNAELEERAKERTAELSRANQQLQAENAERKRWEENLKHRTIELQAINEELEAFSYSVSHDLRAPLRAIEGFSQALLEDYAERLEGQGEDFLQRIRAATQKMDALIDDLLALSRVTRREMENREIDLSALAEETARKLLARNPEKKVEWVIAPGLAAMGDERLMRVAVENLLSNAWKFTDKKMGGRIEFGMSRQGEEKVFFVRDEGVGFDMAYAGKLFTPFQRLHRSSEFPGTGIGLATVRRVIHRHGGRVWAEGEVGRGATFYFTLGKG
jgi:light-regulated signal transduction histidine kinase (bacteriophytochrome)